MSQICLQPTLRALVQKPQRLRHDKLLLACRQHHSRQACGNVQPPKIGLVSQSGLTRCGIASSFQQQQWPSLFNRRSCHVVLKHVMAQNQSVTHDCFIDHFSGSCLVVDQAQILWTRLRLCQGWQLLHAPSPDHWNVLQGHAQPCNAAYHRRNLDTHAFVLETP